MTKLTISNKKPKNAKIMFVPGDRAYYTVVYTIVLFLTLLVLYPLVYICASCQT